MTYGSLACRVCMAYVLGIALGTLMLMVILGGDFVVFGAIGGVIGLPILALWW